MVNFPNIFGSNKTTTGGTDKPTTGADSTSSPQTGAHTSSPYNDYHGGHGNGEANPFAHDSPSPPGPIDSMKHDQDDPLLHNSDRLHTRDVDLSHTQPAGHHAPQHSEHSHGGGHYDDLNQTHPSSGQTQHPQVPRATSFQQAMDYMSSLPNKIGQSFHEMMNSGARTVKPRRRALLVGLDYKWAEGQWNIPVLNGGIADCHRVARVLTQDYGFESSDVRMITDTSTSGQSATRETVLDGVAWLMEGASPGDSLVFYYAGHTSSVFLPQQERPMWAGQDQALAVLCLMNGMIFCYEMWIEAEKLPAGSSITMFIDAPFGHTMLNLPLIHPKDQVPTFANDPRKPLTGVRYLPPRDPSRAKNPQRIPSVAPTGLRPGVNAFIFGACSRSDMAREVPSFTSHSGSEPGGLFTLALCDAMKKNSGETVSVIKMYQDIQQRMGDLCSVAGSRLPVNGSGRPQCPSLSFMPQCLPEKISFILPPRSSGINQLGRVDEEPQDEVGQLKGQISSLQGMVESLRGDIARMAPAGPTQRANSRQGAVMPATSYPMSAPMMAPSYSTGYSNYTPRAMPISQPMMMPNAGVGGVYNVLPHSQSMPSMMPATSPVPSGVYGYGNNQPVNQDRLWPYEGGVRKLK